MSSARDQVSRLLALVPYLQRQESVSLAQVADVFGVTPDQIRQDLRVLWMCGLPGLTPDRMIDVDMEAIEDDPEGVVRIDNADFLARPVRLGSSEAAALIVALQALREAGSAGAGDDASSSHEVVDRVLAKLGTATAAGTVPPVVEVHLPEGGSSAAHLATLREAIDADRAVRLRYYVPARDETTDRVVDPLAVLVREGHDYLDAWCYLAGGRRLFRLDRVEDVGVLGQPRARRRLKKRDLSAGAFAPGPDDVTAVLHLERHARWVADYHPVEEVTELGEGRLEVRMRVGDPRWLVRLALRLGTAVHVVEPAALREQVRRTAAAASELYRG